MKKDIKPLVYLNCIYKDTEPVEIVRRQIESIKTGVDGIYATITYKDGKFPKKSKLAKYLESVGASVSYFEWVYDFAAARNFAMSKVPQGDHIYLIWLDADDVFKGVEKLQRVLLEAYKRNLAAIYFEYWYQVDLDANGDVREIVVNQKRERLVRNDGTFTWIGMLHETLISQRSENVSKIAIKDCTVIHLSDSSRHDANIERNVEIMEKQLQKEGGRDPRTLIYLGRAYMDKAKLSHGSDDKERDKYLNKAIILFNQYIEGRNTPGTQGYTEGSGWREERSTAWSSVAEIAMMQRNPRIAISALQSAIDEAPEFPQLYVDLATAYVLIDDFTKAKHWLTVATNTLEPQTTIVTTPRDLKMRALEVSYQVNMHEMKLDKAMQDLELMDETMPKQEYVKERMIKLKEVIEDNKAAQSIVYLGKYLENKGEKDKLPGLVEIIPSSLAGEKFASEMRHLFVPPKTWENNEIAILCGAGCEQWSPKSLLSGIGGSEAAVIYLAKELTSLGWKITVYGAPGQDAGEYDGVKYVDWWNFNPKDDLNILVLWRSIGMVDFKPKSKFTMLWLHDVPSNPDFTVERVGQLNKIAVLSEYHKSLLRLERQGKFEPMPEDKVFLTANGTGDLAVPKDIERDPHKMIYQSSPDRGLVYLLNMWPKIRQEVPDATLDVFYGFEVFDKLHSNNPSKLKFKEWVIKHMEQPGITYHGRVGRAQLHVEQSKSAIWAYPTDFTEISCITAMECQALGAIPVCTTMAALEETVKNGIKVDVDITTDSGQDEYVAQLIRLLKDTKLQEEIRKPMMEWAQKYFPWGDVARNWDRLFKISLQNPDLMVKREV